MQTLYYPCKFALIAHTDKYKYDKHLKGRHSISLIVLVCLVPVHLYDETEALIATYACYIYEHIRQHW